jgi:hypothetical protein
MTSIVEMTPAIDIMFATRNCSSMLKNILESIAKVESGSSLPFRLAGGQNSLYLPLLIFIILEAKSLSIVKLRKTKEILSRIDSCHVNWQSDTQPSGIEPVLGI